MNNEPTIDSMMRDTVNRNLLKYAAGRVMFCPYCNTVLDCRTTVIVSTTDGKESVLCARCFDAWGDKPAFTGVVDGRQLWAAPKPRVNKPRTSRHTFRDRLEYGLLADGWARDYSDRSKYHAWRKAGETDKYFTGPSGALRRGECASRSYSVGDALSTTGSYPLFLQKGDEALRQAGK